MKDETTVPPSRPHWRSLDELAGDPAFVEALGREFPEGASEWDDPAGRRRFLKLMGASIALAGVTGCTRQPRETIWPYAEAPEDLVPGRPEFYATAALLDGFATGILVESHLGRPTKVEGNPDHPSSLGATDAFAQASVLGLYDPDRSKTVTRAGEIRPFADALDALRQAAESSKATRGDGLRILTGTVTSPTLAGQIERLLETFPAARWHAWDPVGRREAFAGAALAWGEPLETNPRLDAAAVILSLDADLIGAGPGRLARIRELSRARRPEGGRMARLYVAETTPTLTGAAADHRLPLRPSECGPLALAVAAALGIDVPAGPPLEPSRAAWAEAVARDLRAHAGASVVVAGERQPAALHALVHAINHRLGNVGRTVFHTEPIEASPLDPLASLRELVDAMDAGRVSLLLVLGGNPVYDAPADLRFAERLERVALRVHLGLYADETAALCHWHIPEAHPLESWTDARAHDGTVTIVQPLIEPLYDGKTAHELLAALLGEAGLRAHDIVKAHWKGRLEGDFEPAWRRALSLGVVPGTAAAPREPTLRADVVARAASALAAASRGDADGLEIVFRPDPTIHDGRFANNGWLQELPKPLTRLTWDNAAMLAPATAERLGVRNEDRVVLDYAGRTVEAPAWILPGQPDGVVTVHLGYGRARAGRLGSGAGFDAYALRTSDALTFGAGLALRRAPGRWPLATTQKHHDMEGRELVRVGSLEEYREHPDFARHRVHAPAEASLLAPHPYEGHAWGMVIDLNACVGCNACVVACQAENNIPIVGREEVRRGREMHWIRVDQYHAGSPDNPAVYHQPLPCMQCENAPCEVVCPVAATVHSSEGLNDMVYNRCVGTRYCSNNCPYKVRRFNFLAYADTKTPSLKMLRNPDVTVRTRGVMEKCTYCVQRINAARNRAILEDRTIEDGDIVTACQAACPAEAIVFGDLNDPASRVSARRADPRDYGLLAELGTRPRTTYLAKIENPNPAMETA